MQVNLGQGVSFKSQEYFRRVPAARFLREAVKPYRLDDLEAGGAVVAERVQTLRARFSRMPESVREVLLLQIPEMALNGLNGRGQLVWALVKHLGFNPGPKRVVEFYSGADFTGPIVLSKTHYTQVSRDPLVSGFNSLPSAFLEAANLQAFSAVNLALMSSHLPKNAVSFLEMVLRKAMPNLRHFQGDVKDYISRPENRGQADVCFSFFWMTAPSREMEMAVRPGGFMVTVDLSGEKLEKVRSLVPRDKKEKLDCKGVRESDPREELSSAFMDRLNQTPGYKELDLRVVIYQKRGGPK